MLVHAAAISTNQEQVSQKEKHTNDNFLNIIL